MTGPQLKKLRSAKKLSRTELGEKIRTSARTVEGWEQGRFPIPANKVELIRLVFRSGRKEHEGAGTR